MINVLFIGGPMDGQRLAIEDGLRTFYAYEKPCVSAVRIENDTPIRRIEYRAEKLCDKWGRDYVVMSLPDEHIIERLLNGYTQSTPNQET